MKKKSLRLMLSFCLASFTPILAQNVPTQSGNYYDDVNVKEAYFDSIRDANYSSGDSTKKIPGYSSFLRWKDFWDVYMPKSGSYQEALEIYKKNQDYQKQLHLNKLGGNGGQALIVNPVNWNELGPKNLSQILTKVNSNWIQPHINNPGTIKTGAHVGKVRKLYQHPTNEDIIYALGGDVEECGGGVFISEDKGYTWRVFGTDQIHLPKVTSLAIKPLGEQPDVSNEHIFISLATGAVYRTSDNGVNWIECGYNGQHSFPYDGNAINNNPLSLPYDFTAFNFSWTIRNKVNEITMTKRSTSSGPYSRLVVAREGGLYYSNSFDASLTASSSGIDNDIMWFNFGDFSNSNLNSLLALIPNEFPATVERVIQYSDFEWYVKNGSTVYLTLIHIMEVDGGGNPLGRIRQYLITSTDFGVTWSFMGEGDPNSPHGKDILEADLDYQFRQSNIEVKNNDPNVFYIASSEHNGDGQTYSLHKYDINTSTWSDLSSSSFYALVGAQPHAFALNPSDENNWWFFTNQIDKYENGNLSHFAIDYSGYGKNFHPDVRDILVLDNELLSATDGGVYRSTIGANDHIMDISSDNINMSQSYSLGLAQSPPFFIASGFWHSGLQVYSPSEDIWHYGSLSDGKYGEVFFLNNERFSFGTQYGSFRVIKGFDNFTSTQIPTNHNIGYGGRFYIGSENIHGRSYFMRYEEALNHDRLGYNEDDFNTNNFTEFTNVNYPLKSSRPFIIPNEPDKVAVYFRDQNDDEKIIIYNGLNKTTPEQIFEKEFNLADIYEGITGVVGIGTNFNDCVFDHRRNGRFWAIIQSGPEYGATGQGRIVEYDPITDDFIDIAYPADDDPLGGDFFPNWMNLSSLEMDRETGVLYLGTTHGVYYLDRDNQVWRKYSQNVPMFNSRVSIRHCTGEIFASTSYRGIWYADLIRNENTPAMEWSITQNETWEERMNLFCTLVVEPGATLTVKDELVVYGNQKIVVKPGGRLIIDGGTVTSECGSYWKGIEVWGNYQDHQSTVNQGYLLIKNNSTIEYARIAVRMWEPDNWSSTGGILQAVNSTFKNNRRSIEYMPYHYFTSNGNEYANKGKVVGCEFLWTDEYEDVFGTGIEPAITLYDIFGVRISGSDFRDERTYIDNYENRAIGIKSIDANYKVTGRRLSWGGILNPGETHHNYDPTDFDPSTFENLYKGVEALNANSQSTVTIDQCKFLNSRIGVHLNNVDNAMITRNYFDFESSHFPEIFKMNHVWIQESSGFKIEGNSFNNQDTEETTEGTIISNSGIEQNELYRNTFDGTYSSNLAFGVNTNDEPLASKGLQWLCNDYNNFRSDQTSYGGAVFGDYKGVRLKQGLPTEPAGNKFSDEFGTALSEIHFKSSDADEISYFAKENDPVQIPIHLEGDVTVLEVSSENECQSNFGNTIIGVTVNTFLKEGVKSNLEVELNNVNSSLFEKKAILSEIIEETNSGTLYEAIQNLDTTNWSELKQNLENASPFLTTDLMKLLGNQTNPHYPHDWFTELILLNPEVAQSAEFMAYLLEKPEPLPQVYYDQIDFARYRTISSHGNKINEIVSLDKRSTEIVNLLLKNALSDTAEVNWNYFNEYLNVRDDEMKLQQNTDLLYGNKKLAEANNLLTTTEEYVGMSPYKYINDNLYSYVEVKRYIRDFLLNDYGVIEGLDSEQITHLVDLKNSFKGYIGGAEASNLLCFHANICEELTEGEGQKSMLTEGMNQKPLSSQNSSEGLILIPNPNKGTFVIKTTNEQVIKNIHVYSVDGREIDFEQNIQQNQAQIILGNEKNGVYYLQVLTENNERWVKKFVVHQ